VNLTPREIAHAIMRASLSHGPVYDYQFAPSEFPQGVPMPDTPPTYPEINPNYPGPFLRDPGELDPWEERYRT
jgi:hypothetical protein